MVEFALVAPVFFLMFFGVIEFALINSAITAFNFAAKDSARIGSLLGRTDPSVDQQIVNDVVGRTGGLVVAQAQLIEVYRSDAAGSLPPSTNPTENSYPPTTSSACSVCAWAVASRNDSLLSADYLGVRISYVYTYLTAFVSGGDTQLKLSALSVQRIEPQDYQGRHAHPPATAGVSAHPSSRVTPCANRAPSQTLTPSHPRDSSAQCPNAPVMWLSDRALGVLAYMTGGLA